MPESSDSKAATDIVVESPVTHRVTRFGTLNLIVLATLIGCIIALFSRLMHVEDMIGKLLDQKHRKGLMDAILSRPVAPSSPPPPSPPPPPPEEEEEEEAEEEEEEDVAEQVVVVEESAPAPPLEEPVRQTRRSRRLVQEEDEEEGTPD